MVVDLQDVDVAREILASPELKGKSIVQTLTSLLESNPEKALQFILGLETPAGRPTLEAFVAKTRVPAKKVRRAFRVPDIRPASMIVTVPVSGARWLPGDAITVHPCPFENLNPVQSAAVPFVAQDCNIVVACATSAGKTFLAEMMMAQGLELDGKVIYLSPLKAVSQEKADDWRASSHPWSALNVSIVTGDYVLSRARRDELKRADVIVLTSEMLDSKTRRMAREQNTWLTDTAVLVVDEAHLITMDGRGDALEAGLMRFTAQNPRARVVLLSATMPNVEQLAGWLERLNGKPTVVIRSAWRPTKLTIHWESYSPSGNYHQNESRKRETARELIAEFSQDKFLVFVHSKAAGRRLLSELSDDRQVAEFHNADLKRDQRLQLEKRFRHGDLRVCIATSTLAWGVNMPARRVIVLGVHRGLQRVDPIDIHQEAGRAGRTGLDPEGDAYVLLPGDHQYQRYLERYKEVGPLESCLNEEHALAFHITAEVAEGDVEDQKDVCDWFARSFAHHLEPRQLIKAKEILDKLVSVRILQHHRKLYKATALGRVSSWLYFSPFDVAAWFFNFQRLVELDRTRDDVAIAWALGNVPTQRNNHLPRELAHEMSEYEWQLKAIGIEGGPDPTAACLAYMGILGGGAYKHLVQLNRGLVADLDRMISALQLIDHHVLKAMGRPYWDLVSTRVRNSCSWDAADLCRLHGIGKGRAEKLIRRGITSVQDLATWDKEQIMKLIGKKTGARAHRLARELSGEKTDG